MNHKILKIKKQLFCVQFLFCASFLAGEERTFDEIFPGLAAEVKTAGFSPEGWRNNLKHGPLHINSENLVPGMFEGDFETRLASGDFSYICEGLFVIPNPENVALLDIYNSLLNVEALTTITYNSATRKRDVPLFEEAYFIESPKSQKKLPVIGRRYSIPDIETMFVKAKDINLGSAVYQSKLRGISLKIESEIHPNKTNTKALIYILSNLTTQSLFILPVIKAGNFESRFYLEAIAEGILLYSTAAVKIPNYVDSMLDMPSALQKRLDVLIEWALLGLKR